MESDALNGVDHERPAAGNVVGPACQAERFRTLRRLAGPAAAALGVWCAAGQLTVESADEAVRIGVAAPVWWLLPAMAVGLLIPGWRRSPALAAPALLPVLPWLPVSWPPVVLLWTGGLAWLPIGLAVLGGVAGTWLNRPARPGGPPVRNAIFAGSLTLLALIVAAALLSPRLPSGDEPHYLLITQSLLLDGDLAVENNYTRRDHASYFPGTIRPHYIRPGQDGVIYSIHAPGVPAIVLPAFAAFGYRGAQGMVMLLAAATAALVWYLGWLATSQRGAAWFGWAAVSSAATFLVQGVTVFPDGPGAFAVAASLTAIVRLSSGVPRTIPLAMAASVCLAALPWMHSRFAVLAAGFGLLTAFVLLRDRTRSSPERWRGLFWFGVIPALSAVAWFAYFQILYGTPNPSAPYGDNPEVNPAYVPGGIAGLLFDQQFGLVIYAPVLAAAAIGVWARSSPAVRHVVRWSLAVGLAYAAAAATYWMWWAGVPAPPARFAAAILPVFAMPLALAWQAVGTAGRMVLSALLTVSLATSAVLVGVDRGALVWNTRDGYSLLLGWMESSADLHRAWPSFFWRLIPGDVSSELTFALHVLAWGGVFFTGAVMLRRLAARFGATAGAVAATWYLPLALMAVSQVGWWVSGSDGLEPGRAQLAVARAVAEGRPAYRIASASIGVFRPDAHALRIRAFDARRDGHTLPVSLAGLPPGTYEMRLATRLPQSGTVALFLGRADRPFRHLTVDAGAAHVVPFTLPAGAARLRLEPDPDLADTVQVVEIRPAQLNPAGAVPPALASLHAPAADLFFLDDAVFVEPDAFWVRGARRAHVLVSGVEGQAAVRLELANGGAPNTVEITTNRFRHSRLLAPFEVETVAVPLGLDGRANVHVTSPAGFRPADDGMSTDARFLGVRVKPVD